VLLLHQKRLVVPIRPKIAPSACFARIKAEILDLDVPEREAVELMRLLTIVELPSLDRLSDLDNLASSMRIDEVVHCAGCVEYFDKKRLQLANVELTCKLLDIARVWQVQRFIYLSTAYCAGYRSDPIPERLHPDPAPSDEPTEYTRSKRVAEWCIADSGVPFVIIRPSVVIGHSRTGRYTGKNYGLYQMWRAFEGLLCYEYYPIWHVIAPPARVDFVHQDAFQAAFLVIYGADSHKKIVHVVADQARQPTLRDLCWMWTKVYWPVEIHSYASIDDVPLRSIPARQRRFLELTAKNFEIAAHSWKFETTFMDTWRAAGGILPGTTLETISRCQRRYIEGSPRIREHIRRYANRPGGPPQLVDISPETER
jgi:nucleoside-diphosphate-sugar epimerase